ncbi:MAG: Cof-type HAD-IIB family hydrolase [Defluviitaleaceae bacterium]|nr:Cof-type HAD-IIB family hydrolase [Defluviitaleaceae bacterium]
MNNIKMIVTDLDGTLLRDDKTISERTLSTLKKCRKKGIKVVYATGRGISAEKLVPSELFDGYVRMNGATAFLSGCEIPVHSRLLPISEVRDLLIEADKLGIKIAAEVTGMNYSNFDITEHWPWIESNEAADFTTLDIEIEKIFAIADTSMLELFKTKTPKNTHLHISRDNFVMIMHEEARKSNAVAALVNHFGLNSSEIAAFGDDSNDIDLLKYVGVGIAMGNAIDEVKAVADCMCDSNENDGLAKWLEKNVL